MLMLWHAIVNGCSDFFLNWLEYTVQAKTTMHTDLSCVSSDHDEIIMIMMIILAFLAEIVFIRRPWRNCMRRSATV